MTARRLLPSAVFLFLAACGGAQRDKVIRVLFDAPPSPDSAAVAAPVVAYEEPAATSAAQGAPAASPAAAPFLHAPFARGDCEACHSLSTTKSFRRGGSEEAAPPVVPAASRLVDSSNHICYGCHEEMTVAALGESGARVHAAVVDGSCLVCHEPHKSVHAHLLRAAPPGGELCLRCHSVDCIREIPKHEDPSGRTCTNCHDPHACTGPHLLKNPGSSTGAAIPEVLDGE
jgi:predicted CXXCH cytochrome family protein